MQLELPAHDGLRAALHDAAAEGRQVAARPVVHRDRGVDRVPRADATLQQQRRADVSDDSRR